MNFVAIPLIIIGVISIFFSLFVKMNTVKMDFPKNENDNKEEENSDEEDIAYLTGSAKSIMRWIGGILIIIGTVLLIIN